MVEYLPNSNCPIQCTSSLVFYPISEIDISSIIYNADCSVKSIVIKNNAYTMPPITITNNKIQYKDLNNQYIDFDSSVYKNINYVVKEISNEINPGNNNLKQYEIAIYPQNCNYSMQLGDLVINPFNVKYLDGASPDGSQIYSTNIDYSLYLQ